jgi:hypothetical protein
MVIDELILESALRQAGAILPNVTLQPALKVQLIRAAQLLDKHINTILPPIVQRLIQQSQTAAPLSQQQPASPPPELVVEAPDTEESIHRWISNAPELARLRMYYLLYLHGARIDGIEGKILKEERKLKDRRG